MVRCISLFFLLLAASVINGCNYDGKTSAASRKAVNMSGKINKTDADWRKELTPEQYRVLRQKGTERPFTGKYWNTKTKGVYKCSACGQPLFDSETKFDAGCGWPSFFKPIDPKAIETELDESHGMIRTEVHCSRCGGHIGHVFEDGPNPTGLRYCANSVSLELEAENKEE